MANKYPKKCLTALAIKEIQVKITLRFHLTLVRMTIMKKNPQNQKTKPNCSNFGHDVGGGGEETIYTVGGNVN
jgi:hypothetical protein